MFRLQGSKTIKCIYCDHKGQSMVHETTSVITYILSGIFMMFTWEYTASWLYIWSLLFIVIPFIGGIFRIQIHSCKNCLNEVKQSSIFNYLDLDDNVFDMAIGNFALVIKRKTLLYSLCVVLAALLSFFVFEYEFVMAPDGAFSTLDS